MKLSKFGQHYSKGSGILSLMDDLGKAMEGDDNVLMLGGGNPAYIPEVQQLLRTELTNILETPNALEKMLGDYDTPQGKNQFLQAIVNLFNTKYDWGLTTENIALTNGSQNAFYYLFNMFAGDYNDGSHKKILLPLAPEYIGYADIGLTEDFFIAVEPKIEIIDDCSFKYKIDFNNLEITNDIGAVCVSRPTNPTGNVLTDNEISKLRILTKKAKIPLIIDNAYGTPFPNIIYTNVTPVWDEDIILSMSLSKFGLPGTRTGIVIAEKSIIDSISALNALMTLAPGSVGCSIVMRLVESGDIIDISRDIIQDFYFKKSQKAFKLLSELLKGIKFYIHKPEGALFLWLWLPDFPITSQELYERLKKRGVLVIAGDYFFPGINKKWKHKHECIRITYAQNDKIVEKGLKLIADEIRRIG